MFIIKQWIEVTALVSVLLLGLKAQPQEDNAIFDENLANPNLFITNSSYIREILNRMARKGDQYLKDSNRSENQILVIAVLSASEFDAKKKDISDDMIKIFPNENISNQPDYCGTIPVHGEMLAIHFKNTMDDLCSEQRNPKEKRPFYVFMFSHYIPCAGLTHIHYSCAEELANLGRVNKERFKIIVGYRSVWRMCSKDSAFQFLQEGGIHTLMNISSGLVSDSFYRIELEIYQDKLTRCLNNLTAIPEDDIACFINTITKSCTSGRDLYGYMTQFTKAQMHDCVEEKVTGNSINIYARYCSLETLRRSVRLMLGRPTRVCDASWNNTADNLNWAKLYTDFPDTAVPKFSFFFYSFESLEELRQKCNADRKETEKKSPSYRNLHRNKKLQILIKDIKTIQQSLKSKEKKSPVRERTRPREDTENSNNAQINIRQRQERS